MSQKLEQKLPDKKIPRVVMIIGTFELAVALLGLVIFVLAGQMDAAGLSFLFLLTLYGAMGAGLWAIQEWARTTNIVLHLVAIPYALYTAFILEGSPGWQTAAQLFIAAAIVVALTRPAIRHKFKTAVPRQRS